MNPLAQQVVINSARKKKSGKRIPYSDAKRRYRIRGARISTMKSIAFLAVGVLSAGFGLKGFLMPNHFIDGGATGISLLISTTTNFSLSLLLILVNIPFMVLGYKHVSLPFVIRTIFAIIALAICVEFINYPVVTKDRLLIAVFGGFFLGAGIGLAVRGGGVLDGTEVLAIYISRRVTLGMGDIILILNLIIFSVAAYYLTPEIALYAIITYYVASKTVNFIVEGIEEYTGITIISPKNEEISKMLAEKLGHGITIYRGVRGFGKQGHVSQEANIVYTVITRLEVSRLKSEVHQIDPYAFMVMASVRDAKGGIIKKRPLKKL